MATAIPPNQAAFSLQEIAQVVGARRTGRMSSDDPAGGRLVRGISTDSRAAIEGKLFVALSGERFDGHQFLNDAIAHGAAAVLVERSGFESLPVPVLEVSSTLRALGDLARCHRRKWGGKLVAVAGSAGKTTTRVAVESVLASALGDRVHATLGNLNNQVGVPMTLLGLTERHEIAVVELGTNHPGEVTRLADLCMPNVAVLTLIGLEHTERLGDLDGVELEEGRILAALGPDGRAIGNGDDARVMVQLAKHLPVSRRFSYGCTPGLDYCTTHRMSEALDCTRVVIERNERVGGSRIALDTRLLGLPGAMAVTAAIAVADAFGIAVDPECASAALLHSDGETGRLRVHPLPDGTLVLDDSYNANPPSMLSSIALANEVALRRSARLIMVLGEMLELGALSEREHASLGTQLGEVTQLIAVGEQTEPLHRSARANSKCSEHVLDAEAAASQLLRVIQPGDVVLVKGSRGVHLEAVVGAVMAQKGFVA